MSLDDIKKALADKKKFWVVFTGDSLTSCEWVHPNWRDIVIYVLQKEMTKSLGGDWRTSEWGVRGFNSAYDGATTRDILSHIEDIILTQPDLTIGLMGGNDPLFGVSVAEHFANINHIVTKLIAAKSRVVWCTSTPAGSKSQKNLHYAPYATASLAVIKRPQLQLVDMFTLYQGFPLNRVFTFRDEEDPDLGIKEGDPDLSHPNQLGNAYIA